MAVIPVYNMLALPGVDLYLKTEQVKRCTGRLPYVDEKMILVFQREQNPRELNRESFYPIGITGYVVKVNENGYFILHTKHRVVIEDVSIYGDSIMDVSISRRREIEDLNPEEERERLHRTKGMLNAFADRFENSQITRLYIAKMNSIEEIAATMSPWMMSSNEEKVRLLEEDSQRERAIMLEKMILENVEMTKVNLDARSAQEEDYQKIYRESAIKKQMEFLQKELDELHPEEVSDVRRFELAIAEAGMNEIAKREANKVVNRLKQEGKNSPESGMLYDYLDFLTGLSWKKEEPHRIDLDAAERILDEDHYGLGKVKNRILQQIAVMNLRGEQSGSILLFVGAPGTGKTSIGQSIAKALGREYVRVSLGGVRDEADIRGHRRTYIGAMPGRIMDGIKKSGVSNPVMVLDEIDKLGQSYNGDPASALLEVLDPEQNNTFTDHYMNVPYDLSDVLFICTANTLDTIPGPLLDRMEVIRFTGYSPLDKLQIARNHLLPRSMERVGIPAGALNVSDEILRSIITEYTREAGVRGLKKCLDQLCRTVAVRLVRENGAMLDVTEEELRELLDAHPIRQKHVGGNGKPGVVTGLAWTAVGGEILNIETLMTPGSGQLIITGQLGDVMKESAQIALSLVKSIFPNRMQDMKKKDVHIHVPDGATPKDGPSAGITITTALSSLISGAPVPPEVGMTGEVTLQGKIGAIGGLPEKLMAAQRAGVKIVYIPEENVEDLKDVPEEVRSALEIRPVNWVMDVLGDLSICENDKWTDGQAS
ncbi:MAG: endopeptidase La [Clostridia bacterium]|nr:endopeptidase La [Clostridia bacterium]